MNSAIWNGALPKDADAENEGRGDVQFETVLIIGLALAAGGLVKGVTGTGLPMVAIPVMAAFIGVQHAVAVMAIPTVVTNAWLVWSHRNAAAAASRIVLLLLAGALGVVFGTWGLVALDERLLSLTLAGVVVCYVILTLARPSLKLEDDLNRRLAPGIGLLSGTLQGATGMSGPLVVTYAHARRMERETHVFVVAAIYLTFAAVQMPALLGVGILTPPRLVESALALVPIVVFMWAGTRLARRFSQRGFNRVILALLVVMAAKLIHDGAWGG